MAKSNLKYFFARFIHYKTFIIFSFFLFGSIRSNFLYAATIVQEIGFEAEAEKIVWVEEDGKLKVKETGELQKGEILPDNCRICVSKGDIVVKKDGQEIKVGAGQFLDVKETQAQKGKTSYVKVAEGKVIYQAKLEDDGKSKSLGDPIAVDKGEVLLKKNECFEFVKMSIPEFEELEALGGTAAAAAAAAQIAQAPALPGAEPGGEDPAPCASAPC